jgi:hypothetical protein
LEQSLKYGLTKSGKLEKQRSLHVASAITIAKLESDSANFDDDTKLRNCDK